MNAESLSPKHRAAHAASLLARSGMTIGLGSGSTAHLIVDFLGKRVAREGLHFEGVATSEATARQARGLGIPLRELDDVESLDLNLDGADEVDRSFQMIKGRGGALLREKIVACAAKRRVTIITEEKRVERLGLSSPVPVEISPIGARHTEQRLKELGAKTTLRNSPDGARYRTDGGNFIVDCCFKDGQAIDPSALDARLKFTVGVFETGLFIGLCDLLIVGHEDRVEQVENLR